MNTVLSRQIDQILVSAHVEPAVSIILPFNPKMMAKHDISQKIQRAVTKVEVSLRACSNQPFAKLVRRKLKNIIDNLNYSTFRKAIAIYVSPVFEKVLYLDIDVEEKVMVDESFEIRDLVYAKKENYGFLVLFLGKQRNTVWFSNGFPLKMIRSIVVSPEPTGDEADIALNHIMPHYPYPVLVVGPEQSVGQFRKHTVHSAHTVDYLVVEAEAVSSLQLDKIVSPLISNWHNIHDADIRNKVFHAAVNGQLTTGLEGCLVKAAQNNRQLLVVEKNYLAPLAFDEHLALNEAYDHFSCVKDAIDDLIERVLSTGGDVEFVADGELSNYDHVVLIDLQK